MAISRITEIKSSSALSFDDAIKGIARAQKLLKMLEEHGLRTRKFSSMKRAKYQNTASR